MLAPCLGAQDVTQEAVRTRCSDPLLYDEPQCTDYYVSSHDDAYSRVARFALGTDELGGAGVLIGSGTPSASSLVQLLHKAACLPLVLTRCVVL